MGGLHLGILGGLITSGVTAIGALPILLKQRIDFKDIFYKYEFFIGLLLAVSVYNQFSQALVMAFFLGVAFIQASKSFIEKIIMPGIYLNEVKRQAVFLILFLLLKNIPEGLAAGAAMSMPHSGLGNSLLMVILIQDLVDGLAIGLCFLSLGLSPFYAFLGALGSGGVEAFSALLGGYSGREFSLMVPLLMAFSAGAMVNNLLMEFLSKIKISLLREKAKIYLDARFVNAIVVLLLFIF